MNSLFLSPGDDPYAHLRKHAAEVGKPAFEGVWASIEMQLDPFSRQRYVVGVVVSDLSGEFSFRLLEDTAKLECLYRGEDLSEIRFLLDSAEHTLSRAARNKEPLQSIQFESDALLLGDLWPTSGPSLFNVLNRLFRDTVPLNPRDNRRARDFPTLDNEAVRGLVDDELKRIAGLAFEQLRTQSQRTVQDPSTGESHRLEFTLEPPNKAGSVISAVYKTPNLIELNFLRASRDLATYARLKRLRDEQLGLFVMTPEAATMSRPEHERLDNLLGELSWNLEKQGFVVAVHADAPLLARDIWDWASITG